tara:strand:- start:278 stop:496 length:219 start_codon:yes stop_codon:yes gene_type:complete
MCLSSTLRKSISAIGSTKVTIIKSSNGATRRNALILFFLSAFLKLILRGTPSVVKICSVEEIETSLNIKGRE